MNFRVLSIELFKFKSLIYKCSKECFLLCKFMTGDKYGYGLLNFGIDLKDHYAFKVLNTNLRLEV